LRAFVSGIAGFIGSHVADRLLHDGWEVDGIDNLATGRRENVPTGAKFYEGDILDGYRWGLGNYDVLYHTAASYRDRSAWERDATVNSVGTISAVRQAEQWGAKLVYFQTSLCYGPTPPSPVQIDAPLDPRGSYAVSKTAGEAFIRDSGIPYVSLRLANIYGPRNLSGPVPTFYKRLTAGEPCTVVDSRRDFVFIDDLVWMAVTAARQGQGPYHISSGDDFSIAELYETVIRALRLLDPSFVPPIDTQFVKRGPDDVATLLLDPSVTVAEFGWRARTTLGEGVIEAVDWYRRHGVGDVYTHLEMRG
jgi:UDP-glucose 4-epimerase